MEFFGRSARYWLRLNCILQKLRLDDEAHFGKIEEALRPIANLSLSDRVAILEEKMKSLKD